MSVTTLLIAIPKRKEGHSFALQQERHDRQFEGLGHIASTVRKLGERSPESRKHARDKEDRIYKRKCACFQWKLRAKVIYLRSRAIRTRTGKLKNKNEEKGFDEEIPKNPA